MEGVGGTTLLRKVAAHWSLAGDKQLLDLLQNLHERIVTKCQEANSSLEEMVNNLDSASISLQNVNNRLMALSNSQFVESRVYEDDVDVAALNPPVKESPKPTEPASELSKLRDSLRVLEGYHEPVHIVDSDSDSASDEEEDRLVFKPKDLYADRPLPYIIGSQQWRSKWHAGLVAEDSDTDSAVSKASPPSPSEQYSDSEPDRDTAHTDKPHASQRTISTNSSIGSELTIPTVGKPADIAAELARRLGGNVPRIRGPEPESPPAAARPAKVYRPQQPAAATIFSDEPPPLDPYQSDQSDQPYQSDSEDDVFAELHKNTSHRRTERSAAGVVDQLFGNVSDVYGRKGGFEDDVDRGRQPNPIAKQPSPLFEEPKESELFADNTETEQQSVLIDTQPETSVKKPVGGISLFGNNRGAEGIGAAILKRNQRKVSTSEEENEEPQQISKISDYAEKCKAKTESRHNSKDKIQKDIINDLFSKSNKAKQVNKVEKMSAVKAEKPINKKVDLFADDLFDDIDNIFTNVKPPVKETQESTKKSLFDDDNDDLFANVEASSNKTSSKPEIKSKNIFDSDDDLFTEEIVENNAAKLNNGSKSDNVPLSISNDALFSEGIDNINKVVVKTVIEAKADHSNTLIEKPTTVWKSEHKDNETNRTDSEMKRNEIKSLPSKILIKHSNDKGIFDSDSDDDILAGVKSVNNVSSNIKNSKHNIIHNTNNKAMPHNTKEKENGIRKIDSDSILHKKDKEITIVNEKDEIMGDDSLFKKVERPLNITKEFSIPQNNDNDTKSNVGIDQLKDNNKKTDHVLTESRGKKSEMESTSIYSDDLLSSANKNENIMKDKELSSILPNTNAPKTQFQSPSLFDEDDDLDDIFTKGPDGNTSNEDVVSNSNLLHPKEPSEGSTEIKSKSDVYIASNKNKKLIQSVNESQTIKPDNIEPALKKDSSEVFQSSSSDLKKKSNINLINNSLQESEVLLSNDDNFEYSVSIPNRSMGEEKKENKTEYDNILTDFKEKESLFFDTKESVSDEPDVFSDIFTDIPPEFERPKEPKRSKNVNALFDDDSDDEALFFKKNEIVTDEKPDVTFTSQDDRLFHIFHDEPPAMDVDFTQKSKKTLGSDLETPLGDTYPEIIPSPTDIYERTNVKPLFREEMPKEPSIFLDPETEKNIDDAKKPVGKLKPMNFNINVSTLLPGASPKKTKSNEQIDGQIISTKSTEDVALDDESKMVKSVSFEGDPESEVLDNKLSKERAKIQVKRRPSSRRARKEAVRKSGIDFGDDSTDNSSSIDVSKKDDSTAKTVNLQASINTTKNEKRTNTSKNEDVVVDKEVVTGEGKRNSNITNNNEVTDASIPDVLVEKELKSSVEHESKLFNNVDTNMSEHIKDSNLTTAFIKRPNVTSKVVYILNDEDIFTDTKPVANLSDNIQKLPEYNQKLAKNKVLNIVDDDDELFKPGASKNMNIETIGNVYKDGNLKNNEIDKLDSNEDIFKASQSKSITNTELNTKSSNSKDEIDKLEANIDKLFVKTRGSKVKSSLFGDLSDDETELFGSKKSVKNPDMSDNGDGLSAIIIKEVQLPKNDVKRSLFGDENDDDLFAVKPAKKELSQPSSKPKEVTSKPTEPVFEDPLSMLREEDDM